MTKKEISKSGHQDSSSVKNKMKEYERNSNQLRSLKKGKVVKCLPVDRQGKALARLSKWWK